MTDDRAETHESQGLLGALLSPLRAPERVFTNIETIAASLLSVEGVIQKHLTSVDGHAGALRGAVGTLQDTLGTLQTPLKRIDQKVTQLAKLEQVITERMEALQAPLERVDRQVAEMATLEESITKRMDALQAPLERVDRQVAEMATLEESITKRMDALDDDLNKRILSVEQHVGALRPPIEKMSADLAKVVKLLPDPNDGALTRLKDTFTSS